MSHKPRGKGAQPALAPSQSRGQTIAPGCSHVAMQESELYKLKESQSYKSADVAAKIGKGVFLGTGYELRAIREGTEVGSLAAGKKQNNNSTLEEASQCATAEMNIKAGLNIVELLKLPSKEGDGQTTSSLLWEKEIQKIIGIDWGRTSRKDCFYHY